jgi:hypothetical protein
LQLQELLRAAEKALASGLGDWHLQSIQDISPEFEQHVLMGALGPEALKHKHQLPEPQILHLYGLLHGHCTGFQQEVQEATAGAQHREQLLACIWTAFAQLWDECVQVSACSRPPVMQQPAVVLRPKLVQLPNSHPSTACHRQQA